MAAAVRPVASVSLPEDRVELSCSTCPRVLLYSPVQQTTTHNSPDSILLVLRNYWKHVRNVYYGPGTECEQLL